MSGSGRSFRDSVDWHEGLSAGIVGFFNRFLGGIAFACWEGESVSTHVQPYFVRLDI